MPASVHKQATTAFKRNLEAFMEKRDWSAKDVARAAGVSVSFIYAILNGDRPNPSIGQAAKIAHGLGVELEELVQTGPKEGDYETRIEQTIS